MKTTYNNAQNAFTAAFIAVSVEGNKVKLGKENKSWYTIIGEKK